MRLTDPDNILYALFALWAGIYFRLLLTENGGPARRVIELSLLGVAASWATFLVWPIVPSLPAGPLGLLCAGLCQPATAVFASVDAAQVLSLARFGEVQAEGLVAAIEVSIVAVLAVHAVGWKWWRSHVDYLRTAAQQSSGYMAEGFAAFLVVVIFIYLIGFKFYLIDIADPTLLMAADGQGALDQFRAGDWSIAIGFAVAGSLELIAFGWFLLRPRRAKAPEADV